MKTTEAIRQILRCHVIIVSNIAHNINYFVTQRSWFAVITVVLISSTISIANIMSARAERDSAQKKQAQLQEQVEQLSCVVGARKEIQR